MEKNNTLFSGASLGAVRYRNSLVIAGIISATRIFGVEVGDGPPNLCLPLKRDAFTEVP